MSCKECAFVVEHTEDNVTKKLCLAESASFEQYKANSPKSAAEETPEFLAK